MGLKFGWHAAERRVSIWRGDDALSTVPPTALAAWEEDGDASHLEPYLLPGRRPSHIEFRALTMDEAQFCRGLIAESDGIPGYLRACLMAFRIAVSFPDAPHEFEEATGARHPAVETFRGYKILAGAFVDHLQRAYPGLTMFYGQMVLSAATATEAEKKASSQPSTELPSSRPTESQGPGAGVEAA